MKNNKLFKIKENSKEKHKCMKIVLFLINPKMEKVINKN